MKAGIPNITGSFQATPGGGKGGVFNYADGAFYRSNPTSGCSALDGNNTRSTYIYLNLSRSNTIYGSSNTVTPQSLKTVLCIKF